MLKDTPVVNGFSTDDTAKAKEFYGSTLGFTVEEGMGGILTLQLVNGGRTFIYPKPNHEPATFTIIVDELTAKDVEFEHYPDMHMDDKGIAWGKKANMGPNIAWFKDPAGNILSLLEN